jgi:hypothetical protein
VLIELEKIAREVDLPETEVRNLVTYAGVRRERGGFYEGREVLKMLVKHLREKLYGCAAADYAEKPRAGAIAQVEKHNRPVRTSVARRKRETKSPWSGSVLLR